MFVRILLFTPNVMKSLGLYTEALGLRCVNLSENYAEVQDTNGTTIIISKAPSLAYTYTGFNPILMFQSKNFEEVLDRVQKYGCQTEGPSVESDAGKVSYLKSPEGLSFALKEVKETENHSSTQEEDHPAAEEIKKFIRKLKL
ncbi:hypothetical protein SteCoe_26701 [Stentor coeruleus]|uniref:VOC domain-containing protein n=1 Tax=Stentor coeruleus TaxID=5963 RepID=A0A1R2BC83_9CILI|nr:hypothetical protein SteCoe_26701 [Stentor coeruleus]